ncbi:MAG: hypothetical protein ACRERV_04620 [Methylococcales bacterium]
MYPENVNPRFRKQPLVPYPSSTLLAKEGHRSVGYNGSAGGPEQVLKTQKRLRDDDPGHRQVSRMEQENPDFEKLFLSCTTELLALLRYTRFLSFTVVERCSRKLRAIDIRQPMRGIAVLDQLTTDYWSVFVSNIPRSQPNAETNSLRADFEQEMKQIKASIDRLGKILISMETRSDPVIIRPPRYWFIECERRPSKTSQRS